MEKCRYLLECGRFEKYFLIVKKHDRGLFSGDDGKRRAALEHLNTYCNNAGYRHCPDIEKMVAT